jgi:hypothetical protein
MGLWSKFFKPKKTLTIDLRESSHELKVQIEKDMMALFRHKEDEAFKRLERVFSHALKVQLMETNAGAKEDTTFHYHYVRGRLDALHDVVAYFHMAQNQEVHAGLLKKFRATLEGDNVTVLGSMSRKGDTRG